MSGIDYIVQIGEIWKEVLGIDKVSGEDNFFELGGDSIMVTIMALQVEAKFNVMVETDWIYDNQTLNEFSECVSRIRDG